MGNSLDSNSFQFYIHSLLEKHIDAKIIMLHPSSYHRFAVTWLNHLLQLALLHGPPTPDGLKMLIPSFISVSGFCLVCWMDAFFNFSPRSTTYLCQCWWVWGKPCWAGERVDYTKSGGKKKGRGGMGIFMLWGSPHLVAKEWLIKQAGTNERFVCPHTGLAVMSLSLSGILQIPPSLSTSVSLWQCQIVSWWIISMQFIEET